MTSPVQVSSPYEIFNDLDGSPLDSGYIYLGAVNQNPETTPVAVYWDRALSLPAVQPIRTVSGFPSRNGTPAKIFTDGYSSITVRNKTGVLVFNSTTTQGESDDTLRSDLAAANSTVLIAGSTADLVAENAVYLNDIRTATPTRDLKAIFSQAVFNIDEFKSESDTYYDNALTAAFAAMNTYGLNLEFGEGTFNFENPVTLTFPTHAGKISGKGIGKTIINFPNALTGAVQLTLQSTADWYDFELCDMSITSSHDGVLVQVGKSDFSDPLNCAAWRNVGIFNSKVGTSAEALRLNYVVNSIFDMCRANCYADGAGANYGKSLNCRQVAFCVFNGGSYGNGDYGISFRDGISYGNVFNAVDVENVNYGILHASTGGRNTFVGGQFSLYTAYLIYSQAGASEGNNIYMINPNCTDLTKLIEPSNGLGVRIDGIQQAVTTPSVPTTGTAIRNTTTRLVEIHIWGGAVTAVTINGFGIGQTGGTFMLRPWDTIAMTYTTAPNWNWRAVS